MGSITEIDLSTMTPEQMAMLFPMPTGDPTVTTKIITAIWCMFAVATIFLVLRIYCRASKVKAVWWDDHLLIIGWVFLLTATSLQTDIQIAGYLTTALGNTYIGPRNLASDSIMKLSLALIKTSFALTVLRIAQGWTKWIVYACLVIMNTVCVVHAVLVWRGNCGIDEPHVFQPCWEMHSGIWMNMIGAIISAVTDYVLVAVALHVIWGLQMKKVEKFGVGIAMSLGILAGVVSIVRAVESHAVVKVTGPAFGYRLMKLTIWIPAEPCAAIVAACIPVLRIFFRDVVRSRVGNYKYGSHDKGTYLKSTTSHFHGGNNTNITAAKGDDDSDRSILNEDKPKPSQIQRTHHIKVEYETPDPADAAWKSTNEIEMGNYRGGPYR